MHIYSEVRVPSIHPVHEELRSGCAIDVHGTKNHGKNYGKFTVELLGRSSTIMSLEFDQKSNEIVAISRTGKEIEKVSSYECYRLDVRRFHLHLSVSDCYFDIELNGSYVGCFVPTGDVRNVEAIGIKGDLIVNIMTIEGFPYLKSWNTVCFEWTEDTFKHFGYPTEAKSQSSSRIFGMTFRLEYCVPKSRFRLHCKTFYSSSKVPSLLTLDEE